MQISPSFKGRARHLLRAMVLEGLSHSALTRLVYLFPPERRKGVQSYLQVASTLRQLITPSMNCIDVGAYAGDMLRIMVDCSPEGRHFAWEPLPYMARFLVRRFPTVEVRCAALSDREGETAFTHVRSRATYSGIKARAYPGPETVEELIVPTERLDSALPADYVPHLLKIDVEGAELQVLRGAFRTLHEHKPYVLFEHGRGGADFYGTTANQIYDFLVIDCGLVISDIGRTKTYSRASFEACVDRSDFLAHP